jgi:hypothetical protein
VKLLIGVDRNHLVINQGRCRGGVNTTRMLCTSPATSVIATERVFPRDRLGTPYQAEDVIGPVVVGKEFAAIAGPEFGDWYFASDNSDVGEQRRTLAAPTKWDSTIGKLMGHLLSATKRYKLRLSPGTRWQVPVWPTRLPTQCTYCFSSIIRPSFSS